jgi:hypothetical protein
MTEAQGASGRDRIRALNDRFRQTFVGGRIMVTATVAALPSDVLAMALRRVASFDTFTPDNDPHGEHDFGGFTLAGHSFYWKIDLYEGPGVKDRDGGLAVTRVLTIMLAEEY